MLLVALGQTAFHVACGNGHATCVRALGSSFIHAANILYGCTLFLAACRSGCDELVVWLFEMGVNIDIETPGVIMFKLSSSSSSSNFSKFSSFGGGGAVSDVAIARFWCFGGDMTETAVTDLVGMV